MKWTLLLKPSLVLDMFSSWGYFISYITELFPNITTHGFDGSITKVEYCRKKGQTIIYGDVRVVEPTKVYDLVYFYDNLGYFDNPIEIAQKVAKWGQYVIFTTPIFESGKIQIELDGGLWKSYIKPEDHYEISGHIGKMVDYEIVTCSITENKWTCSLIKVVPW